MHQSKLSHMVDSATIQLNLTWHTTIDTLSSGAQVEVDTTELPRNNSYSIEAGAASTSMSRIESIRNFFEQMIDNVHMSIGRQPHEQLHPGESPPRSSLNRRQSVAAESFDPEKDDDDSEDKKQAVYPKTDEQRARLGLAVKEIILFRCLDEEQKASVIDAMQEKQVKAGEVIITQGDDGDNFYVVESGTYDIYVRGAEDAPTGLGQKVGSYVDKGSFGELALMYNTSRAATIKADTDGIIWSMDRNTFRRIVLKAAFRKRQLYETLLEEVPLFQELSSFERINVADALHSRMYKDNDVIITQGEQGKEMYFIESGTVKIVIKERSKEVEVNRLGKGGYFGELALITKKSRAASAYAVGLTKLAVLDVASFERLMGPCLEVMRRNIDTYDKQLQDLLGADYPAYSKQQK